MTISDEIFRLHGVQVNDGMAIHFTKTDTESLQDAERRFLQALVVAEVGDALPDLWLQLGVEQFPAALTVNDVKLAYWSAEV